MRLSEFTRSPLGAFGILAVAGAFAFSPAASAQHADIEFERGAGTGVGSIVIDPEGESDVTVNVKPGLTLFESEFGEFGNDFLTGDPGFDTEGGFVPGSLLEFEVQDSLLKWNPVAGAWESSGFDEIIDVIDVLDARVPVSSSTGTGATGPMGLFEGDGSFHDHIEFEIESTSGTPMDGAYLLELALFTEDESSAELRSNPFLIAFHLDAGGTFGEEDFEMAIDNLVVPIPAALPLFLSALGVGWFIRRRRS
ncbi:MAG: hypothetical protein AAF493_13875 [Pseudomonadota bacterium]